MDPKLNAAVEVLVAQLNEQMKQVADTKSTINALLRSMGKEPMFQDVTPEQATAIRPDLFYGKPLATSAQLFLQRRGQACRPEEILQGLVQGGFDFRPLGWREDDRLRSLAISLAKNNKVFHKLPNGTFGLLSQYPELAKNDSAQPKKRRGRPRKKKEAGTAKDAKEGQNESS